MQQIAHRFIPRSFANEWTLYQALQKIRVRDIPHKVTQASVPPNPKGQFANKPYCGELRLVPVFEARTLDEYQFLLGEKFAAVYSPPDPEYECHKVAFLSTAHITMLTYTLTNHGSELFKVIQPFDPSFEHVPADLQQVYAYMAKEDVAYVVFDKERPPIAGLEVYAW
ncbi:hypothetical protein EVB27_103 [Rhizobium phage RHph_TM16]|nr:hypothetical protein EVB27_103 [Rhizobium phage RHph_TM16]